TVRGVRDGAGKWGSRAVGAALHAELVAREFDVIWLDGLHIAHYLPLVRSVKPNARVVLRQFNLERDRYGQFARRQHGLKRVVAETEWQAARRFERETLRAVDAVGAVSAEDVAACRQLAGVEALNVPHLVPVSRRTAPASL